MDHADGWFGRGRLAHREQVLDLVVGYRYYAPAMLAMDETYARLRAESTLNRQLMVADSPIRPASPVADLRRQLGAMRRVLGDRLRAGGTDRGKAATRAVAG
jgi:hypothetical protein